MNAIPAARTPVGLESLLEGAAFAALGGGLSGAHVWYVTLQGGGERLVLKRSRDLRGEWARLGWLFGRAPAPEPRAFVSTDEGDWLLMSAMPGRSLKELIGEVDPERIGCTMGETLRALHELPARHCPFDERLAVTFSQAEGRVDAGLVDPTKFDPEFASRSPRELLEHLRATRPTNEDLVVCHGDFTPANVLFEGDRVTGVVDVGRLGLADRHRDLALALRELAPLGPKATDALIEAYGLARPDRTKLRYYRLLDQFF